MSMPLYILQKFNLNTASVLLHPPDGRPVSSRAYNLNTASVLLQRTSTVNGHLRAMKFKYSYCSSSTATPMGLSGSMLYLNTATILLQPYNLFPRHLHSRI